MPKPCECGCGQMAKKRFVRFHQLRGLRGPKSPNYRGARSISRAGYIQLGWAAGHQPGETVLEHRAVMERKLGRLLHTDEVVHHINGVKTDNRLENLRLMSRTSHLSLHKQKLTDETVATIRRLVSEGFEQKALARRFGVCYSHLRDIVHCRKRQGVTP